MLDSDVCQRAKQSGKTMLPAVNKFTQGSDMECKRKLGGRILACATGRMELLFIKMAVVPIFQYPQAWGNVLANTDYLSFRL